MGCDDEMEQNFLEKKSVSRIEYFDSVNSNNNLQLLLVNLNNKPSASIPRPEIVDSPSSHGLAHSSASSPESPNPPVLVQATVRDEVCHLQYSQPTH
jgi:hypothetical protein